MMCVCVGMYVGMCVCVCYHGKMKTSDRNDLKLGTVVVLDSLSKHIDFGIKRSRVRVQGHHFELFAPATT